MGSEFRATRIWVNGREIPVEGFHMDITITNTGNAKPSYCTTLKIGKETTQGHLRQVVDASGYTIDENAPQLPAPRYRYRQWVDSDLNPLDTPRISDKDYATPQEADIAGYGACNESCGYEVIDAEGNVIEVD